MDFWLWFHYDYDQHYRSLKGDSFNLEKLGIDKNDLVLSLPDGSPNITLYLMERKGYSNFFMPFGSPVEKVREARARGVKYLLVTDPSYLKLSNLERILNPPITVIDNITLFDIRDINQ
jgi:hypothetical protein